MTNESGGAVAVLGLGAMGRPMAETLLRAGQRVTVYDVRRAAMAPLVALGAVAAATPAEAARQAEAIVVIVHNFGQARQSLWGATGALDAAPKRALVILMSTVSPAEARELATACAERDLRFLDAPVSGGPKAAATGSLSIMVGGSAETLAEARPWLDVLGDPAKVWHTGSEPGQGQAMKMINQLMAGVNVAASCEAMALAAAAGLDPSQAFEIVSQSAGGSWMFRDRVPRMLSGQFTPPNSVTETFVKDLAIVLDTADELGLPLFVTPMARQIFRMALASGYGGQDDAGAVRVFELWTGHTVGPR